MMNTIGRTSCFITPRANAKMKKTFGILLLLLAALAGRASSTNQVFSTGTVNLAVPVNNPLGLTSTLDVSGMSGNTANLTVNLDITGGFNGNLYAYLVSPTSTTVFLLNRVGVGSGNPYGYGNTGFYITLDSASGNNIHNYQMSAGYPGDLNGGGQLTGIWAPTAGRFSRTRIPARLMWRRPATRSPAWTAWIRTALDAVHRRSCPGRRAIHRRELGADRHDRAGTADVDFARRQPRGLLADQPETPEVNSSWRRI